jgi:hypothetical protein
MNDEGRKSLGQIQGEGPNGEIKNVKVDDEGRIMTANASNSSSESILYSNYLDITDEQTIEIPGTPQEIEIANYDEENAITINGIVVAPGIAITIPASNMSTPLTITGTAKIYILVKGEN